MNVQVDGVFSIELPSVPEGDICSLVISQGNDSTIDEIILDNVLFGDVFVCSGITFVSTFFIIISTVIIFTTGQSNMEFSMYEIFNATDEIANSAEFENIRFYLLDHNIAESPQEELMSDSWGAWSNPTEADRLGVFSAVCFLTARYINEINGKKVSKVFHYRFIEIGFVYN